MRAPMPRKGPAALAAPEKDGPGVPAGPPPIVHAVWPTPPPPVCTGRWDRDAWSVFEDRYRPADYDGEPFDAVAWAAYRARKEAETLTFWRARFRAP